MASIDYVISKTLQFLETMPKSNRKKKGQFFTSKETAQYMASLFDLSILPDCVSILDPGAGTGILSAAIVDLLIETSSVKSIHLVAYETDFEVLHILEENMKYIRCDAIKNGIELNYSIISDDYLLSQSDDFSHTLMQRENPPKYDLIIANPPYLRVMRSHPAAIQMPEVVHGAPNLYFLFASMSLFNLKHDCEMVYIIPRSWSSGAYFKAFREYFLSVGKIEHIHLFLRRDKVFETESVLQETIIIKISKKTVSPDFVRITSSNSNSDFDNLSTLAVPYNSIVCGHDFYVFMPVSEAEIQTIQKINRYNQTLPDIGLRMKTGIIVDFRQRGDLRQAPGEHVFPLFYSQHIKNGRVNHASSGKEFDWVTDDKPGLIQDNKNYVFCKRFTAKEEKRRLQCGIYLSEDFPEYKKIGTQNKINFVDFSNNGSMDKPLVYGIYSLLNSTLFDMYYRILNGSTQVNSTEINSIPFPPIDTIKKIGSKLIVENDLSTKTCDKIVEDIYYG